MNAPPPTLLETRIHAYIGAMPEAISGSGGHTATLKVAEKLVLGFALSIDQAWPYIAEYSKRCEPPWTRKELEHKLEQAAKNLLGKPVGYLLNGAKPESVGMSLPRPEPPQELTAAEKIQNAIDWLDGFSTNRTDLYHDSQVHPGEDLFSDAIPYLQTYRPDAIVTINTHYVLRKQKDGSEKAELCGPGETKLLSDWIDWIIVNGPPTGDAGTWTRINPMRSLSGSGHNGAHCDADVLSFDRLLLESDILPFDIALSVYAKVALPIIAIIDSAGRGPHAHVAIQADDASDYAAKVRLIFDLLSPLGIDRGNGNPSRYSRLPGASRIIGARDGANIQELLYLAPEPRPKGIFP